MRGLRPVLIVGLLFDTSASLAANDARFFGTFCGDETVRACGRVCLTPFGPCFTRCRDVELADIVVHVQHNESAQGIGSILGTGTATVDGDPLRLNLSGVVTGPGSAKGVVASNRFDARSGTAMLGTAGVTITVSAQEQNITLSKERCGNASPTVRIAAPADGSVLAFGSSVFFRGEASDVEDAAFPSERLQFASSRDGAPLSGATNAQPTSLEVSTSVLSPGGHEISFRATDSGGLTSTAAIRVTVVGSLQYAAKFICGESRGEGAPKGTFFTEINVINPFDSTVLFRKRFSVGLVQQRSGVLTEYQNAQLGARRAFRVECEEILRAIGSEDFAEGFLLIESPERLNVVSVYSAVGASGELSTLDVENIAGTRLTVKLPDLIVEPLCDRSVRVRNVGAAPAGASNTSVEIDGRTSELPTPPIDAGGIATIQVTLSGSGDFGMRASADADQRIVEASEANNVGAISCIG